MKEIIWSKQAECYDAKHTEEGTVLYYKCLITGKKRVLTYSEKLALSAYLGVVGPLTEIIKK